MNQNTVKAKKIIIALNKLIHIWENYNDDYSPLDSYILQDFKLTFRDLESYSRSCYPAIQRKYDLLIKHKREKYKHIKKRRILKVLALQKKGHTIAKICGILKVDKSLIYKDLKLYKKNVDVSS